MDWPLARGDAGAVDLPRRTPGWLSSLLHCAAGAALLMLAVATDRAPTVFTDSDDYYELGQRIVAQVTAAVDPTPAEPLTEEATADAAQAADDLHMGHTQMASRSFTYGVFLYALEAAGSLWLVTAVQALAAAGAILALWRRAVPDAPAAHYLLGMAVLSAGTSLPFFAGFAMPDIFAGTAVIAVALLAVRWRSPPAALRWAAGFGLTFALAVHSSHLLLAVALLPVAALLGGTQRGLAAVMLAAVAAWGLNFAYIQVDRLQTGETLRRQPFLTARLLADGPGRDYLRHACATGERYVLCRFAHEPLDDSEDILWSDLPANGVFLRSDYATRLALEDEENRFVAGTISYDPVGVVAAALRNWWRQLAAYQVDEPVRDPHYYLTDEYWKDTWLAPMQRRVADCGLAGDRCTPRLTMAMSTVWHGGLLALSATVAAGLWWRRRGLGDRPLEATLALLAAGIVLNAAVCGILSGPFPRYEARLVWLLPLATLLLLSAERVRAIRSAAG